MKKRSLELLDVPPWFGNINTADRDRRATNCRRERGGNWRKSAQVEKRSGEPAQIAVRYPPRVRGYHPRGQMESRSGRLRGSNKKTEDNLCFFCAHKMSQTIPPLPLPATPPGQPRNLALASLRTEGSTPKRVGKYWQSAPWHI